MLMSAVPSKSRLGSRGHPKKSRAAILQAAVREFSREGVAGARIDAIARAARVNKALLYYYFKSKEELHRHTLEMLFGELRAQAGTALVRSPSARDQLVAYVNGYFDFVVAHPNYPRLVQREVM